MNGLLRARWAPLLAATILLGIVMGAVTRSFGTAFNVYVILQTAALDAVIGLSQMVVLAAGDLSLAVGGLAAMGTIVIGDLFQVHHWPAGLAVLAGLVLTTAGGFANGVIIARTKLSGFIVTLATGTAFTGIAYGISASAAYSDVPSSVVKLSQGRSSFFPYLMVLALLVTAGMYAGLRWLPGGRLILAFGGNRDATMLSGLSSRRAQITAHTVSGLLAGVAAVMYMGTIGTATPAAGGDWLIISFAVPIIGGTALAGGEASAFGALVAAVVLSAISDALIVLNVNTNAVEMAEGLLILAAVLASRLGEAAQRQAGRRRALRVAGVNRDGGGTVDSDAEGPAVFEARAISKAFDGIVALDEANLRLSRGEIHALIGENGAGKSTLINIATGVYQPDGGQVILDEAPLELSGPRSAAARGIAVVHQERNLVGAFSVAENLFLGNQPRSRGLVSYRRMFGDARPWLRRGRPRRRPVHRGASAEPGPGAAAGDRAGAVRALPGAVPRRAHLVDQRNGLRAPVHDPAGTPGQGHGHRVRQPQAGRGLRPVRPGHGAARRTERHHRASAGRHLAGGHRPGHGRPGIAGARHRQPPARDRSGPAQARGPSRPSTGTKT